MHEEDFQVNYNKFRSFFVDFCYLFMKLRIVFLLRHAIFEWTILYVDLTLYLVFQMPCGVLLGE